MDVSFNCVRVFGKNFSCSIVVSLVKLTKLLFAKNPGRFFSVPYLKITPICFYRNSCNLIGCRWFLLFCSQSEPICNCTRGASSHLCFLITVPLFWGNQNWVIFSCVPINNDGKSYSFSCNRYGLSLPSAQNWVSKLTNLMLLGNNRNRYEFQFIVWFFGGLNLNHSLRPLDNLFLCHAFQRANA